MLTIFLNKQVYAEQQMASKATAQAYKEKFSDVLLIIIFNHPYYSNIDFLKELYSPFFSHIVFYGENPHPEVTAMPIQNGFLIAGLIKDAIEKNPNYRGYLFLEDDCILNIWNCLSFDLNKIWLPRFKRSVNQVEYNPRFLTANFKDGHNADVWWWKSQWGFAPTKKAFMDLLPHDLEIMEQNVGKNSGAGALCDMFYIPSRFKHDVMRLCPSFSNVFVEIAVPCILCCLDIYKNWEQTCMLWGYNEISFTHWPVQFTCIHPIKLSKPNNRESIATIFKNMIPHS
jgi:hypothetical protein